MTIKEYTLKIKLVCGKCFRELGFNEGSDNDNDVDLEIQSELCPDCIEKLKNETIKKMTKQLTNVIEKHLTKEIK